MESTRFDAIARRMAMTNTRRDAARALAAAGLGLGLAKLGIDSAEAKKKRKKRCKKVLQGCNPGGKRKCCSGLSCQDRGDDGSFNCCKPLAAVCESGEECCVGACIPPLIGTGPSKCTAL